ncbi:C39 family peptidase [Niallia sp. CLA-SR-H024]|uniref:C39 family peptidase n=2 Tax=Bacillales TaxID=1385 RepID=A0ABV1EV09_9BACI
MIKNRSWQERGSKMQLCKLLLLLTPFFGSEQTWEYFHIEESKPKVEQLHQESSTNKSVLLDVPLIKQNPELKYGCEVTSLTMVLNYAGVKVNKMELYKNIQKDIDPLIRKNGNIIEWGDPSIGFVGDMTGKKPGYAVFDKPMEDLVNKYLPERAVNLTKYSFHDLEKHVQNGYPIVVWTTGDYRLPDRWESWKHNGKTIKTPLDLHAVVLVGFSKNHVYLNDPLSGKKNVKVDKKTFIKSWHALKSRAISYR